MYMSLVPSRILTPEQRLAKAISEFEADLSPEQKASVRATRTAAPHIDDVMQLTAEIDSSLAAQGCRKAYGPRVTTFLSGIQQFAALGDVLVGGSQNLVACGAWSVVRICLLAIAKYSPYMDKVSKLFMKLGQILPQMQDFAEIYPKSQSLQNCLLEFYIPVIELCHQVVKFSKQSGFAQIFTNITQTIERYETCLETKSEALKTQVQLEMMRTMQDEAKNNAKSWILAKRYMTRHKVEQQQKYKRQLLRACSEFNYQTYWKQARKAGTTSVYRDMASYQQWKDSQKSSTMLYSGKLGSGKSVLMANMVNDLFLEKKSIVTYFFCRFDVVESLEYRTILGCLARQLLDHISDIDQIKTLVGESPLQLDTGELIVIIKKCASKPIHFVLDGLYDCAETDQRNIARDLQLIQKDVALSLCISVRSEGRKIIQTRQGSEVTVYHERMPTINPDIQAYIESEVGECIASQQLLIKEQELIQEVKTKLTEGADGMFLWVYLQIVSLCSMESNHAIREALRDLPKGLTETYRRLLANGKTSPNRKALFEFVMVTVRPLRTEELREALSIENGNTIYDSDKVINSIDPLLQSCNGLVIVDEEEQTVRFVHHSASQFLTTQAVDFLNKEKANRNLSTAILTYLNYNIFDTQLVRKTNLPLMAVPQAILKDKAPFISKFIKTSPKLETERQLVFSTLSSLEQGHPFLQFARDSWASQLALAELDLTLSRLTKSGISHKRLALGCKASSFLPLQQAIRKENLPLVRLFLECSNDQNIVHECIEFAAEQDKTRVLDIVLPCYNKKETLFYPAISRSWTNLLIVLLKQNDIDPNRPRNQAGNSPLIEAIKQKNITAVDVLLKDQRSDPIGTYQEPLYTAVRVYSVDIVKLLLQNPQIKSHKYYGPKFWFFLFEQEDEQTVEQLVRLMLEHSIISANDHCDPPTLMRVVRRSSNSRCKFVMLNALLEQKDCKVNAVHQERIQAGKRSMYTYHTVLDYTSGPELCNLLRKHGALTYRELKKARRRQKRDAIDDKSTTTIPA